MKEGDETMLTPQQFAKKVNLSYDQVLYMCKTGQIDAIKSSGGHFKIPEVEMEKLTKQNDFVTKEQYEQVVRENERLKFQFKQLRKQVLELEVGEII